MLKRFSVGGLVVFLFLSLCFGYDLFSYMFTMGNKVRDVAKAQIPTEFEIGRAKDLVNGLMPEIKKNMEAIGQEEVQLKRVTEQISVLANRMKDSKSELLILKQDLTDQPKNNKFVYCGKSYTRDQVETDLSNRFERYQVDEVTLASLEQMREARQHSLDNAKKKLQSYLSQKRDLEVKLEQLSARLKMVDLMKTTSRYNFNEDSLGRAKSLVEQLLQRLEVEERTTGTESDLANEVKLNDRNDNYKITEKVTKYFEKDRNVSNAELVANE